MRPSIAMTCTTGCVYCPTWISGVSASEATWSGGTWSIMRDVPATECRDRGQPLGQPDLAHAADLRDRLAGRPARLGGRSSPTSQLRWPSPVDCEAAIDAVGDEDAILGRDGDAAVDPGVGRADRPEQPAARLQGGMVEPDLDAGLVAHLDPIEQVGPPRLVARRIAGRSARSGRGPGRWPRPAGSRRTTSAPGRRRITSRRPRSDVSIGRRELAGPLALPGLLVVRREDRPVEQP